MNLKNISLLQFEQFRKKDNKGKEREVIGGKGVSKEFTAPTSIVGDGIGIKEESKPSWS